MTPRAGSTTPRRRPGAGSRSRGTAAPEAMTGGRPRGRPPALRVDGPAHSLPGEVLLVEGAGQGVLRVDYVGDLDDRGRAQELVGLHPIVPVVRRQPVDHVRARQPQRVDERAGAADRHDVLAILQPRPVDLLALDDLDGELHIERGLDGGAHDLAIALGRVPVTDHEERAALEHREVHGDAFDHLVEVHVGAIGAGHQRADALLAVRRRTDGPEKAADRYLDSADLALGHVQDGHVPRPIELPDEQRVLDRRRDRHRLVLGREGPEVRNGAGPAPVAVGRDLVQVDLQGVAGLGALDVEGAGLWVDPRQVEVALGDGLHGGPKGVVGGVAEGNLDLSRVNPQTGPLYV